MVIYDEMDAHPVHAYLIRFDLGTVSGYLSSMRLHTRLPLFHMIDENIDRNQILADTSGSGQNIHGSQKASNKALRPYSYFLIDHRMGRQEWIAATISKMYRQEIGGTAHK
ncbi:hypothetical protein GQX74_008908 [Glossina fuscipes]|nr:hypothetical protein GQX74_008908 [Glossina fuscipes]